MSEKGGVQLKNYFFWLVLVLGLAVTYLAAMQERFFTLCEILSKPCIAYLCPPYALRQAAQRGDYAAAFKLLHALNQHEKYTLLRAADRQSSTAVYCAAYNNHTALLQLFFKELTMEQKYNLLMCTDICSCSPLHWAFFNNNPEMITLMFEALTADQKADLLCFSTTNYSNTPFHFAALYATEKTVQLFFNLFSDVQKCSKERACRLLGFSGSKNRDHKTAQEIARERNPRLVLCFQELEKRVQKAIDDRFRNSVFEALKEQKIVNTTFEFY